MQKQIERMAQARGIDLTAPGAHFRVESGCFMPLVVENIGADQISVTHYYEQNGDLCQDPEIVFVVIGGEWFPVEWTTPPVMLGSRVLGGYKRYAERTEDGWQYNRRGQRELAIFANHWADNLRAQGFA